MGQAFRKLFDTLFGNTEIGVVMVGLDNAGKTTILYKLQIGKVVSTIPTIGFNAEKVEYKNVDFIVWDNYFNNFDGLIYVVDCHDRERIDQVKEEFQTTINDPSMLNKIILVFTNKQDLKSVGNPTILVPHIEFCFEVKFSHECQYFLILLYKGAMTITEVCEGLGLFDLRNRKWHIQGTCALKGDGLFEGLDWLASTLKEKKAAE
ncbi:ADP-ribosylation factor family protein [Medicago truncatula]|uniref:ADP-ribosylation factor family protein n=1 Tax=Medicago truncatula TaxID=3880 RepID=G7K6I2_MEDTR|nr:ADP-ribosylation factor family protein [Medicago truncatula]